VKHNQSLGIDDWTQLSQRQEPASYSPPIESGSKALNGESTWTMGEALRFIVLINGAAWLLLLLTVWHIVASR